MESYVEKQEVKDNGMLINADIVNNNYYDNLLNYCCDRATSEHPEDSRLKNIVGVMQLILNQDGLKRRFGGELYKYQQLIEYCRCGRDDQTLALDDGFKSVIACIYNVASKFSVKKDEAKKATLCMNCEELKHLLNVTVTDAGLELKYTKEVSSLAIFKKIKSAAEKLIEELLPYIQCASRYGNFFQFNQLYINHDVALPFLTESVKFKVSNEIIPNLIRPLYGDSPECGLREIVQNALDACKEYKKEAPSDSAELYVTVKVEVGEDRKRITVRDNGIGMTKEILLNKYFVVGESSKKESDVDVVGQFGIGALAAFLLGDQISVRTKNEQENVVYQFSYALNPQEKDNNIDVMICKDADFTHGTEVCIDLMDSIELKKGQEKTDLRKKMKLDEWYVLTGIPIRYWYNGEEMKLRSYEGEEYQWETLEHDQPDTEVKYCLECKNDTTCIDVAHIIYNGLMLPERYTFPKNDNYLRFYPLISIKSRNHAMKLNLERTRIESGHETILMCLREKIIAYGTEELRKDTTEIVNAEGQILQYSYYNKYLKNIPLFFNRNGFGVYSIKALSNLQQEKNIKGVMRVYGELCRPVKLSDLKEDRIYIFYNEVVDRTKVSDFIESEDGTRYISPIPIRKYFVNGMNQYNGLRKNAMIILYNELGIDMDENVTAGDLWAKHNKHSDQLFFDTEEIKPKIDSMIIGTNADEEFKAVIKRYQPKLIRYTEDFNMYEVINEDIDIGIVKPNFADERTI